MYPGYCHRQAAVGTIEQTPPALSPLWRIWGESPVLGKDDECQLIDLGQQRPSVGPSVLQGLINPQAGIWQMPKCPQCGLELSKAELWGEPWPTPRLVMAAPRDLAGWHSQQSPGWKPDHTCKNIFVHVSFCFSCYLIVVLHYKLLEKSFVLHCLTCWRGCVGRKVRALIVNLELSVSGIFTARQHNEILIW